MFRRLHRDYLSLTRGERRGMQILSLGVIILVVFRTMIPLLIPSQEEDLSGTEKEFIAFQDSIMQLSSYPFQGRSIQAGTSGHAENRQYAGTSILAGTSKLAGTSVHPGTSALPEPFTFDPNKASITELARLGIPMWTARTLINYRDAGAVFKKDSDLLRVYGLAPEIYSRLKEYILIDTAGFSSRYSFSQDTSGGLRIFDLNHADSLQLISVHGIGPVYAYRIISYRELLGGFYSPDQLLEVYGFTPTQYQELMLRSFLDTSGLRKLDLNRVDAADLSKHPYLDRWYHIAVVRSGSILQGYVDSVFIRIRPYLFAGHQVPRPVQD